MAEDLVRFLDSISFPIEERKDLENIEIEKVLLHKKDKIFEVCLKGKEMISYATLKKLNEQASYGIHGKENIRTVGG